MDTSSAVCCPCCHCYINTVKLEQTLDQYACVMIALLVSLCRWFWCWPNSLTSTSTAWRRVHYGGKLITLHVLMTFLIKRKEKKKAGAQLRVWHNKLVRRDCWASFCTFLISSTLRFELLPALLLRKPILIMWANETFNAWDQSEKHKKNSRARFPSHESH